MLGDFLNLLSFEIPVAHAKISKKLYKIMKVIGNRILREELQSFSSQSNPFLYVNHAAEDFNRLSKKSLKPKLTTDSVQNRTKRSR
jgi:hypothetical protein